MQFLPPPEARSIVDAREAFENLSHTTNLENLKVLQASLRESCRYCALINYEAHSAEVARMWLVACRVEMKLQQLPYPEGNVVDYVTPLIQSTETIRELCDSDDNERFIAFMCLKALVDLKTKERLGSNCEIARVISLWTGKTVKEGRGLTVKSAVKHLYGNAVYDLYSPDVEYDIQLPEHLYKLNVPLLGVVTSSYRSREDTNLKLPDQLDASPEP